MPPKTILILINFVGGILVIGSYVYGIKTHPQSWSQLWGNLPDGLKSFSSFSMIFSVIGYFLFSLFILLKIDPNTAKIANVFNFRLFYVIYTLILFPSAFWMSLTFKMIDSPSSGSWFLIRAILIIVGLASLALVIALLTLSPKEATAFFWLAVAGATVFFFQTGINDAIIWARYFLLK